MKERDFYIYYCRVRTHFRILEPQNSLSIGVIVKYTLKQSIQALYSPILMPDLNSTAPKTPSNNVSHNVSREYAD